MKNVCLVIVDTAQIQPYIFGSNRLRENIGASDLVARATEQWALDAVQAVSGKLHNIGARGKLSDACIENGELIAEVMYAGGGNFVVLFKAEGGIPRAAGVVDPYAVAFTRALSRTVLEQAPELQLVIEFATFDWCAPSAQLYPTLTKVMQKLAVKKRARALSVPLLGQGVTVICQSTGLPATGMTPKIPGSTDNSSVYPASAEILAKVKQADIANKRLSNTFGDLLMDGATSTYDFPRDFDELGRSIGEQSHIAVVHADGNGMGKLVQKVGEDHKADNRDYITAIRAFSKKVKASSSAALAATLRRLIESIEQDEFGDPIIVRRDEQKEVVARIPLGQNTERTKWNLPVRPIVFGGDDVTFVCDGRLGLALATEYLAMFRKHASETLGLPVNACAGVAIVKVHYPFARAYDLAEALCTSAKRYRAQEQGLQSCLDWHFALSGLSGDIEDIRHREFRVYLKPEKFGMEERYDGEPLTLRPVSLESVVSSNATDANKVLRSWDVVNKATLAFQGPDWTGQRNKIKALRQALRQGPDSVQQFRVAYCEGKLLPDLSVGDTESQKTGWYSSNRCVYFDAVELADFHIPLRTSSILGEEGVSQ